MELNLSECWEMFLDHEKESAALGWIPGAALGIRVRYPADKSPYCNLIGQSSLEYTVKTCISSWFSRQLS